MAFPPRGGFGSCLFLKPPAERVERRCPESNTQYKNKKGPWLVSRGKGKSGRKRELGRGGRLGKRGGGQKNTDTHAREKGGGDTPILFRKAKEAIARETGSQEARRRAGDPQSRRVDPSRGGGSRSALPRPGCRKKPETPPPPPHPDLVSPALQSDPTPPSLLGSLRAAEGVSLAKATMSPDETVYLVVLLISVPVGFLFKQVGPKTKKYGAAVVGLVLILVTCQIHILHSFITILGTWLIINISPRSCHHLTLAWAFSYLLFFRTVTYFNYPEPTTFTNAVQLLLTLKLLSLAIEVQELIQAKKQEVTTFTKSPVIGTVLQKPGLVEILCYSYCYVGLMTGPFYRYRTYHDWLNQIDPSVIPSWQPMLFRSRMIPIFGIFFLVASHFFPLDYVRSDAFYERGLAFRLFYMVPIFFVFRMRFYVAWLCAECTCIAAAFGAYPVAAKSRSGGGPTVEYEPLNRSADGEPSSVAYDYETIKNIDPHGTDFCVKVKDGMRYWNMTVQWWLAQYIYKSAPFPSYVMRSAWTMLISAYWHGIHPGYYISFLTIPLCLAAEGAMERGFLKTLSPSGRLWGDWIQWFLKMRAYDYMCMGFVLLTFEDTLRYWSSVYYCIHVGAVFFFLLGTVLGIQKKWGSPKDKQGAPENPKQQE